MLLTNIKFQVVDFIFALIVNLCPFILLEFIHTCESLCHEGDCRPCSHTSNIYCRCGFKKKVGV